MPKKEFKERSSVILRHSFRTTTRDPFRQPSRTVKGLPGGDKCMQISSRKNDVYVLAGKYSKMNMCDRGGKNTFL